MTDSFGRESLTLRLVRTEAGRIVGIGYTAPLARKRVAVANGRAISCTVLTTGLNQNLGHQAPCLPDPPVGWLRPAVTMERSRLSRSRAWPRPRIPDDQTAEDEAHDDQEVIVGPCRAGGDVEDHPEHSATMQTSGSRDMQQQGQHDHDDRSQHDCAISSHVP